MELTLPAALVNHPLRRSSLLVDDDGGADKDPCARAPLGSDEGASTAPEGDPVAERTPDAVERPTAASGLEPLSPFIGYTDQDRQLPSTLLDDPDHVDAGLVVEILRDPEAICRRLLDADQLATCVIGCALIIPACTAFFAVVGMAPWAASYDIAQGALLAPANLILAIAAALGPTWGVSVLMAVRLPFARLVATLLAAVASGSLLLVALSPLPYALWKLDDHWAGPIALLSVFAVAGIAAGGRLKTLLLASADEMARRASDDGQGRLSEDDAFRVAVLARMGMVSLAFASCLAVWAFNPFS